MSTGRGVNKNGHEDQHKDHVGAGAAVPGCNRPATHSLALDIHLPSVLVPGGRGVHEAKYITIGNNTRLSLSRNIISVTSPREITPARKAKPAIAKPDIPILTACIVVFLPRTLRYMKPLESGIVFLRPPLISQVIPTNLAKFVESKKVTILQLGAWLILTMSSPMIWTIKIQKARKKLSFPVNLWKQLEKR